MASREVILRRVKFDLLGLPPTPNEVRQFVTDRRPDAYARMVERMLANPRYGEKWGRRWLDLVRFADTAGFNADPIRPLAYKYRDYVIRSFNRDTPFDRFVREQLAGDELYPADADAWIATGYNRMWPDESNASDILLARQDALNDLTANVGAVFLGLSVGCAQCHDHKFDPILQKDFYRLQSFFAGIVPVRNAIVGTRAQLEDYSRRRQLWLRQTAKVRSELHELETAARVAASRIKRRKFPFVVLNAIDTAGSERSALQRQLAFWSERQIVVTESQLLKRMTAEQRKRRSLLKRELAKLSKKKPRPPRTVAAMVVQELASGPAKTHLLAGGSYTKPKEELIPDFLSILKDDRDTKIVPPRTDSSGRRSALARWMTRANHPLTARVIVNRIWLGHFGRGLVENANDFGTQTKRPIHPQLLDWLASEFVRKDWSIKHLHRLILTSRVYRQDSDRRTRSHDKAARQMDPGNIAYWHFPRQRLTGENLRDAMLMIAGDLNQQMYGPGVRPPLPPKFSTRHGWKVSKSAAARNRRSIYIHAQRNLPYPLLQVFDLPDMHESCARRAKTTVAPQALFMLNSRLIERLAERFSRRVQVASRDNAGRIRLAIRWAFGRSISDQELKTLASVLEADSEPAAADKKKRAGEIWNDFCHALLNASEFIYID